MKPDDGGDGRANARPLLWPLPLAFIATVLAALVANVAVAIACLVVLKKPFDEKGITSFATSIAGISVSGATTAVVLGGAGLVAALASGESPKDHLRLGPSGARGWQILHFAAATFAMGLLFGALADLLPFPHNSILDVIGRALATTSPPMFVVTLLCLSVAPGIGEELFFRGYLQGRLERRIPTFAAVLIASVLFGLFHFDLKQSIYASFVGVFLGVIVAKTGSLRASIVPHALSNATGLVLARLGIGPEGPVAKTIVLVLAAVTVISAIVLLARMPRRDTGADRAQG